MRTLVTRTRIAFAFAAAVAMLGPGSAPRWKPAP